MQSFEKRAEDFFIQMELDEEEAEERGVSPSAITEGRYGGGYGSGLIQMRQEYRRLDREAQVRGFSSVEEFRARNSRDHEIAARISRGL